MSNGPLFDDEDLPSWLKNAGITYGSGENQPAPESSTASASGSDNLSWLEESTQGSSGGALPFGASLPWDSSDSSIADTIGDAPDWMKDLQSSSPSAAPAPWTPEAAPEENASSPSAVDEERSLPWEESNSAESTVAPATGGLGMTGALPWRQGASDPADQSTENDNSLNWLDEAPAAESAPAEPSGGNFLPWRQEPMVDAAPPVATTDEPGWVSSGPPTLPKPPTSEPPAITADDLSWLSEAAPVESAPEPPVNEVPVESVPPPAEPPRPMLKKLPSLQTPAASQPPAEPAAPPAEPPRPAIRKLPAAGQPPAAPPADAPRPPIKKLPTANQPPAQPPGPAPDYSNMTYEQWDQAQAQADQAAPVDPADQLLDEVPDWFKSSDAPAAASTSSPSGEFMPEWFVGQEEQPADAAPDWFSNTDFTNTALVGPETVQNLGTPEATPPTTSGENVPDWFKGSAAGVDDLDFNSMFVAETPDEEPKSTGSLSAKLAALTPEQPPAVPVEAAVPEQIDQSLTDEPSISAEPAVPELDSVESIEPELAAPIEMELAGDNVETMNAELEPAVPEHDSVESIEPEVVTSIEFEPSADNVETANAETELVTPLDLSSEYGESSIDELSTPAGDSSQDSALDWLDMPDLEDLTGSMQSHDEPAVSAPVEVLESEAADDRLSNLDNVKAEEPSMSAEPQADLAPAEDMPGWMHEMQAAAPPAKPSVSGEPQADLAPAEDMPDWMREMQAAAPPAEPSASGEPQADLAPAEDMPDWMREMQAAAPPAEPSASTVPPTPLAAPAEGKQEFDWLSDFDPGSGTVAPLETGAQVDESSEQPSADSIAEPTTVAATAPTVDIDALLNFAETASPPPATDSAAPAADDFDFESELEPAVPTAPAAPTSDQFDASTLDFDALMAAATDTSLAPTTSEPAAPVERVPPQPESPPAAPPSSPPSRLRRLPKTSEVPAVPQPLSQEVAPEWVEAMKPAAGPVVLKIGDQEVRAEERPANILPEELQQLRERARAFAQRPTAQTISAGPLAGITGAIEANPEPTQPVTSAGAASLIVSDLDARRIKLIQNILGVEEEMLQERVMSDDEREAKHAAAGIKTAVPIRPRPKIDRIVISILLAVVMVAPFFTNVLNVGTLPDTTQLSPAQTKVKNAIEAIPANQDVLVAFEYGPTGAGELDDLARAIVRDIVKQGAHPVVVSTNPTGALHAQALMQSLATKSDELSLMNRTDKPLVVRQDFWVLPYLPGGAIGVRSLLNAVLSNKASQLEFNTDIEGKPSGLTDVSINTLQHNPAFVLTESQEDVRNWAEQYQSPPQTPVSNQVKLVLLSSAAASAVAQTYVRSATDQHIIGPLVGLRDAISYQGVRQPLPAGKAATLIDQRWQSIALSTLLAALIILAGAAFNVIRGLQRRTRR